MEYSTLNMKLSTLKWVNADLEGLEESESDGYRIRLKIEGITEYTGLISKALLYKEIVNELAICLYHFILKNEDLWAKWEFFYLDLGGYKFYQQIGLVFKNYIQEINSLELFLECARHVNRGDSPGIKAMTVIDETTKQ